MTARFPASALAMMALLAHVSTAGAQVPLDATFRGSSADAVVADPAGIFSGFTTWTVKRTVFIEGAYINSSVGIDVNLEPGCGSTGGPCPDRALRIRLPGGAPGLPSGCLAVFGSGIPANDVDFRFNVFTPSGTVGIDTIAPGAELHGYDKTAGGNWVAGHINFTISSSVWATLYFNYNSNPNWDGNLTLSRSVDGNTWTLTSTSSGYYECNVVAKGASVKKYSGGTFIAPFELTVTRR